MKKKLVVLLLLLLVGFCGSIMIGRTILTFSDLSALWSHTASAAQQLTFYEFRLPRALLALIAGCGFGFSGFLLQGTTRNELADAGILGVNSGAGLLIMLYLGFFAQGTDYVLPILGIIGGVGAALVVYGIAYKHKRLLSMERVVLSGVAVNAGLSAVTLFLTIQISKDRYSFVTAWLSGAIWGTSWQQILSLLPWVIGLSAFAFWLTPMINLLGFGEEQAISLGVNLSKTRTSLLLIAVGLSACCVAYTGNLAFVGLLAPHISKNLIGKESRTALLASGIIGSILVLFSDTIGRLIVAGGEIPAGVMIAMIGAPYFLFLMIRDKV